MGFCLSFVYESGSRAEISSSEMIPLELRAMTLIDVKLWIAMSFFAVSSSTYSVSWWSLVTYHGGCSRLVVMVTMLVVLMSLNFSSVVIPSGYDNSGLDIEVIISPTWRSSSGWWWIAVLWSLSRDVMVIDGFPGVWAQVMPQVLAVLFFGFPFGDVVV